MGTIANKRKLKRLRGNITDLSYRRVLGKDMKAQSINWYPNYNKLNFTLTFNSCSFSLLETDENGNFITGDVLYSSEDITNFFSIDMSSLYQYLKGHYVMAIISPVVSDITDRRATNLVLTKPYLIP